MWFEPCSGRGRSPFIFVTFVSSVFTSFMPAPRDSRSGQPKLFVERIEPTERKRTDDASVCIARHRLLGASATSATSAVLKSLGAPMVRLVLDLA